MKSYSEHDHQNLKQNAAMFIMFTNALYIL